MPMANPILLGKAMKELLGTEKKVGISVVEPHSEHMPEKQCTTVLKYSTTLAYTSVTAPGINIGAGTSGGIVKAPKSPAVARCLAHDASGGLTCSCTGGTNDFW